MQCRGAGAKKRGREFSPAHHGRQSIHLSVYAGASARGMQKYLYAEFVETLERLARGVGLSEYYD